MLCLNVIDINDFLVFLTTWMGINAIEIKKVPEELFEKVCSIKINLKHWLLSEHSGPN